MKEETKKKLCKISKIVGFAITFGFAVFGVLCAAMLIGNGSKKDDFKTLDSSLVLNEVRSERNIKPRKAEGEDLNYFNNPTDTISGVIAGYGGGQGTFSPQEQYSVKFYDKSLFKTGYYRFTYDGAPASYNYYTFWAVKSAVYDACVLAPLGEVNVSSDYIVRRFTTSDDSVAFKDYFYIDFSNIDYLMLCTRNGEFFFRFELVDTLDIPPSSSISFPESFSPLGLFGDSVTNNGGYVYLPNATGNELDIEITGLIFKYGGVVYDGIHIECVRALSMGYINDDGQLVKQGGANDYMWALSWIKFYQRYKGQSPQDGIVVVMSELKSVTDNANDMPVAFTGRTQWVNRSDRTIQIIDDLGIATGRYDGRYSDMNDKKLMEWVSSSFSIGNALGVMGNNSVFDIFTNAFDSVLPILSIAILPNITLGMLLFIPLIGAIIVIIIRVVKK